MVKLKTFIVFLCLFFLLAGSILATCDSGKCTDPNEYSSYIDSLNKTLTDLNNAKRTLGNQIKIIDIQSYQTQLKITQTEQTISFLQKEIVDLTTKIGKLDISLNDLTVIYIKQVNQNYRLNKKIPFLSFILSGNFNSFFEQYKYLTLIQGSIQNTLLEMETTRSNMDTQKRVKSEKQQELTKLEASLQSQKRDLNNQKVAKSSLLIATKNDEVRFQNQLSQAQTEYDAIQNILVGNGKEVEVSDVSQGQKIANVIQGESCSSSGTHLHFMVKEGSIAKNPFNYLKSGIRFQDFSNGDPFNPSSGNWEWPIKEKIDFNQGYGVTWSVKYTWVKYIYNFHNGIDIASESDQGVFSVVKGKLFRGSIILSCNPSKSYCDKSGKCTLQYVKVQDSVDSNLSTLYLHVNYF